jgi:ATP-dependent helicase/nuclease subunit A
VTLWNTAGGRALPQLDLGSDAAGPDRHDVASWLAEAAANVEAGADAETVPPPSQTVTEPIWFQPAPAGHVPSKVSATDLRRLWVARIESPSLPRHAAAAARLLAEPEWQRDGPTPREKGNAFHRAMHRFDFRRFDGTRASVVAELSRLRGEGWLTEEETASVEPDAIRALLCSEVGRRLLGARRIWREQPFLLRLDVPSAPGAPEGRGRRVPVIVQGVIDCLACDDDGWLILDYKTDDVDAVEAPERAKEYAAQVATYSEAVRRALQADRIAAFLYFSASHTLVPVDDIDIAQVFKTP